MMKTTRALVLGPGGLVGTAWMAGLASGLRRDGVDLAEADLIVGTSAGAIVGAMLATGQDPDRLADPSRPADSGGSPPHVDPARITEVFTVLADPRLEPAIARRRVGELALAAETGSEHAYIARMASLIAASQWPDQKLLIPAVDIESGEPKVWDLASGVPLPAAVASSCAMPGVYPPITIKGRRYMDGALRSGSNTDLATGADVLVVIEPLAHRFPASDSTGSSPRDGESTVVAIAPDPEALDAFGPDLHDRAAWQPAYQSGIRQAAEAADPVRAAWRGDAG